MTSPWRRRTQRRRATAPDPLLACVVYLAAASVCVLANPRAITGMALLGVVLAVWQRKRAREHRRWLADHDTRSPAAAPDAPPFRVHGPDGGDVTDGFAWSRDGSGSWVGHASRPVVADVHGLAFSFSRGDVLGPLTVTYAQT